jgi:hypothetical protein
VLARRTIDKFRSAQAGRKRFGYREAGVARSEVGRFLAPAENLVALETWRCGDEIKNLK